MGVPGESAQSIGRMHIGRASGSIASGKYRLFASLGRGGMADVLLGTANGPAGFNKLVVVKRLRPMLAEDPALVNMFLDEARLAARMNHPNVIHTYDIGEGNGAYFIAMEYLDSQPLHEILFALKARALKARGTSSAEERRDPPVRPVVWAKIIRDALAGLHYAHELTDYDGTPMNVVHRDVSPQNIIVTYDGGVKLVDFGIAKASVNTTRTESGIIKGKLAYMAPEQAETADSIDRRADVFAMGIVLWECLTMQRLITGDAQSAMTKIVDMEFKRPSSLNPAVTPELDRVVMRALERNPDKRFQTAQEMREALDRYIRSEGILHDDEVGALVAGLFTAERIEMRAQILRHMGDAPRDASADDEPSRAGTTPLGTRAASTRAPLTESTRSVRAVHRSSRPLDANAGRRATIAAAVALPLLVAATLLFVRRRAPDHDTHAAAPATTLPARAAPVVPSTRAVRVRVTATPADATLYLDDAELPQNPFDGAFAVDALEHRVRATRAGLTTDTKLVRFDQGEVAVDFRLNAAVTARDVSRARAGAVQSAPSRAAAPAAVRGVDGDAGRPALDEDPWK